MPAVSRRAVLGGLVAAMLMPVGRGFADGGEAVDNLGVWRRSPNYRSVNRAGARVLNLPDLGTFCAYWSPPGARGVMVALHGTGGTPYAEIQDELPTAMRDGYAVLAPFWQPQPSRFLEGPELLAVIRRGLDILAERFGTDPNGAAYCGFSRGAAIAYELTYLDLASGDSRFVLTIAHSGGIPPNAATPFQRDLQEELYGPDALTGTHWVLYAGRRDEEWGEAMSVNVRNAARIVAAFGGNVERLYDLANGTHRGYRTNPAFHDDSLAIWQMLRGT